MAKKRPSPKAAAAAVSKPLRLTGSSVVLVGDNNGCYTRGQTVYFYIDPPDPGPFCSYFYSVYAAVSPDVIDHVSTRAAEEDEDNANDFRTYKHLPPALPEALAMKAKAANKAVKNLNANVCEHYLIVVTRVCFSGETVIIGSVPFRVCDTCP